MAQISPSLSWTVRDNHFVLTGTIDEHADLRRLANELPVTGSVLDLGGIKRINSIGVREWMEFVRLVSDRGIVLERCPSVFVDHLNAIANFRGDAVIRSVNAPWECDSCELTQTVLIDIETWFPDHDVGDIVNPACGKCGREMALEDQPERFFQFVKFLPLKASRSSAK